MDPHLPMFNSLATLLALNFVGDGLETLDPKAIKLMALLDVKA